MRRIKIENRSLASYYRTEQIRPHHSVDITANEKKKERAGKERLSAMRHIFLLVSLLLGLARADQVRIEDCYPGSPCWPSDTVIKAMAATLQGRVVLPADADYKKLTEMKNTLETREPGMVVLPKTTKDVQKVILFATKHTIRVTMLSSGHSYIGRSTAHGSMMIHFGGMQEINADTNSRESDTGAAITVQPGSNWGMIYKEADEAGHIVVGGSAQTVSPAGCTLGGCHSPMSRMLGLAVDNVLGFTAVTANGSIVTMTRTSSRVEDKDGKVTNQDTSDLFWALRGGGGAFAILTSITYKMHKPPAGFVRFLCTWKWDIVKDVLNHYNKVAPTLPPEWGGYLLIQNPADPSTQNVGAVTLAMLHYGAWNSKGLAAISPFSSFRQEDQYFCYGVNYTTFYDYEKTVNDPTGFRTDIYNRFLAKEHLVDDLTDVIVDNLNFAAGYKLPAGCTGTLLGGKVSEFDVDSSAVGPDFRNALSSLSCGAAWQDAKDDASTQTYMLAFGESLHKYGRGVYYNEPGRNLKDFPTEFWRGHYGKLSKTKQRWDPNNVFRCHQCVGSTSGAPLGQFLHLHIACASVAAAVVAFLLQG